MKLKNRTYPSKILLAWGEAIGGNKKIQDWLIKNDYPELGLFVAAMLQEEMPRTWLKNRGFPHLLALVEACEDNHEALKWLERNGFAILAEVARVVLDEEDALKNLKRKDKFFAVIADKVFKLRQEVRNAQDDMHRIF